MTRTSMFLIFFSIVLTIYGLLNTYIFIRGLQLFPHGSPMRSWYIFAFWALVLSYIAARLLERIALSWLTDGLVWIGSYWLGAMVYFVLILLVIDIVRLANSIVPFFPSFITQHLQEAKQWTGIIVTGIVLVCVIGMRLNAMYPRIRTLDITIQKQSPLRSLNVVMASDIHLGTIICHGHFKRIVEKINSLHPDIVLFAGDVVDEDIQPVIRENLGELLREIHSKYGTYAITGNHEYIGGVEPACKYLTEHGIIELRDSATTIDSAFTVIGREDLSSRQFYGRQRKSLDELLTGVNPSLPIILMDHQPLHLNDAADHGIDLQLSGHTHHGQLWPFNYITKAVYELSWGYLKKGNTQYYVSCGVGGWGPPMRSGNTPEIVNLKIQFHGK
jgi:uncharacterized protein